MNDRRVHAVLEDGTEIVRYDRAGKWFTENGARGKRHIHISMAAWLACEPGATIHYGLAGGKRFDAAVRRRQVPR